MAGTIQDHLRPGETIVFQTAGLVRPRGWGGDLTMILSICLGFTLADDHYRALIPSWTWWREIYLLVGLVAVFRLGEYLSEYRFRTVVTEQRLLHIKRNLLLGWPGPDFKEIELADISAVYARPRRMVVETRGSRPTDLKVPTGTLSLASRLAGSHDIEAVVPTRLERIARFLSTNLPVFVGLLLVPQFLIWMLASLPDSDIVLGFIEFFDLEPGELRKTIIALTFGMPIMVLAALMCLVLASLTLFFVVLTFGAHIDYARSLEVFSISPDSQRRSREKFQTGWWHDIEDLVIGTVYQRRQPG